MSVDLKAGIVRILKPDGTTAGTGFVVSNDGLIATCAHVVQYAEAGPGDTVRLIFHFGGEEREARVDPEWWRAPDAEDVAILRLERPLSDGVVPLPLGGSADSEWRMFSTFGFSERKPVEGLPGKCEVIGRTTENGFPVLQLRSDEVTLGFSGAPVWDRSTLRVIGMVVSILTPDEYGKQRETAFIIPSETLARICRVLEVEDIRHIQTEAQLRAALKPLDYDAEIDKHLSTFHGRRWFFNDLEAWFARRDAKRLLLITGPAGVGKSALASSICGSYPAVAARHFCQHGNLEKSSALRCIQSLAYQLSTRLPDYRQLLLTEDLDRQLQDARSAFDRLITQPLGKITPPEQAQVIVIDALDEAGIGDRNDLVDVLASEFDKTPVWLRLVATTRPESPVLNRLFRSRELELYKLEPKSAHNLDDIRAYVHDQLAEIARGQDELLEATVKTITDNSEGLFLIAEVTVRIAEEDLRTGRLSIDRLAVFPRELAGVYLFYFKRYFPELALYRKHQRPLLELVVAAKAPLPLELAARILRWDEYELDEVLEPLGSLFPEIQGTISPFHKSVVEWLSQRKQSSGYFVARERGMQRLAEVCWQWQDVPEGPAREYLLRYGLDHLLDQDRVASPLGSQSLELCERDKGAFLLAAVERTGVQWMEERMHMVFTTYFEARFWMGVARSLLYLRLLRKAAPPIRSALRLLTDPVPNRRINGYLQELGRITDESLQLAIAILAAARLSSEENLSSGQVLLEWASQHHPAVLVQAGGDPLFESLRALLTAGPLPLVRQLVHSPLWFVNEYQFRALVGVWVREPTGPLRSRLIAGLKKGLSKPAPALMRAVEVVARNAIEVGDAEVFKLAFQWMGGCSSQAGVEVLGLHRLLSLPRPVIVNSIASLCENTRLREFRTIRAAVCAVALMGSASDDARYLAQIVEDLAQAADLHAEEIWSALVEHIVFAVEVWALSPARFYDWLSARLPLMIKASKLPEESSPDGREWLDLFRKLVGHLCIVLRWVAAQSGGTEDDKRAIEACLWQISCLAWLDPANWSRPFLDAEGKIAAPLSALDPLRANICWQTALWLGEKGWLPYDAPPSQADLTRAASHEIVRQLLQGVPGGALKQIEVALMSAWRAPLPNRHNGLTGSLWLQVFKAIAASVDVPWQPAWTGRLSDYRSSDEELFPDRLKSYFRRLRERVVQIAKIIGWYPELLQVGICLAFVLGDDGLNDEELEALLVPALASMDAALLTDIPNAETWPPNFLPVVFARVVPLPFAEAIGSLELCDRGMLWQVSQNMCRRGDADWWESVRQFRDALYVRVLRGVTPRVVWYKKGEPAKTLLDVALAPINLLLEEPPQKKDFDQLADEFSVDPDSSFLRLKQCLRVKPRPELLTWSVEKFAHWRPEQALWLIEILVGNSRWDLLQQLLEGLYGERSDKDQEDSWLSGFAIPEKPVSSAGEPGYSWHNELEKALGIGPEEGLIYRVEELAHQLLSGALFQDDSVLRFQAKISLAHDWESRVQQLLHHRNTRQRELIRTLLAVAILSQNKEVGLLTERLVQESDLEDELGPELLWVGRAVVPDLVRKDRILRVAKSGRGLDVLVPLRDWEAVRLHLQSCAEGRTVRSPNEDPLLKWYRACESFDFDEQLICLQIYNEIAPQLLGIRGENKILDLLADAETRPLLPVSELSSTLTFSEYALSKPLVKAARHGNAELVREWFRAVLIEAQYGPDRKMELDRLETLYRCAGAWLTSEEDLSLRTAWIGSAKELAKAFHTRSIWNSFFGGVGMCLEERFGSAIQQWLVREDYGAVLALAEALTQYGSRDDAKSFWRTLLEEHSSPWLALRACEACLVRDPRQNTEWSDLAREFASRAWQLAQGSTKLGEPRFLANITECAVDTENSALLQSISGLVARDRRRAASLGRIALDVFLKHVASSETDGQVGQDGPQHWLLSDLPHVAGMQDLINSLIEQAEALLDGEEDIGLYNHSWRNDDIRTGLGWLKTLLEAVLKKKDHAPLLAWIGSWINRIRSDRDQDWTVCKTIIDSLAHTRMAAESLEPLLDFAISSLGVLQGRPNERIHLALSLAAIPYCTGDCLQILDQTLDILVQRGYSVDRYLGKVAVVCVRDLSNRDMAERYLHQVAKADEKALFEDEIAEVQGVPLQRRLQKLAYAPQVEEITKRMADICLKMLVRLAELDKDARQTLAPLLVRLSFSNSRLDDGIAGSISRFFEPDDWPELQKQMEHIKRLDRVLQR